MKDWDHLYKDWHVTIITLVDDSPMKFKYPNASSKLVYPCWPKWIPHLRPIAKVGASYIVLQRGNPKSGDFEIAGCAELNLKSSEVRELNFQTLDIMRYVHENNRALESDPVFLALLTRYMSLCILPADIAVHIPAFNQLMSHGVETLERWYRETGDARYNRCVLAYRELEDALEALED